MLDWRMYVCMSDSQDAHRGVRDSDVTSPLGSGMVVVVSLELIDMIDRENGSHPIGQCNFRGTSDFVLMLTCWLGLADHPQPRSHSRIVLSILHSWLACLDIHVVANATSHRVDRGRLWVLTPGS